MIGERISHYRVLERLGGGGMGEVFKAEDLRLERRVALKFLPPELGEDPVAKERFAQEAKAASALDHQNICTIYEIDETGEGRLFIAMAFYDGETLKRRLAGGPLPIEEALEIAEQVAGGLAKAHRRGIVHRDIKPANLVLTRDGVVKIVDFGLAKLAEEPGLTKTGTSVGTPAYMSPEQARGEAVDHRTDLWSLGVVLYEMLAGRTPFGGSSQGEILHGILYEEPEPPAALRSGIPPAVERIVERLLTREPAERPSTAQETLEAIRRAREGTAEATGTSEAAPTADPTATWPAAEREEGTERPRRRRALLLGGVVAAVVTLALAALLGRWWPGEPEEEAAPGPADRERIVVLPFENLGPPEHEYFAAGMTEEITSRLAKIEKLGVISRNTAIQYEDSDTTTREIGEELDVGYVLEGSVRWAPSESGPDRVRITPQLIRVRDDTHVWADAYDATLDDVFAVQSDIARQVTDELELALTGRERRAVESRPTEDLDAYHAYLEGRYRFERRIGSPEDTVAAVTSFERAVELDPDFAEAWAKLAEARAWLFHGSVDRSPSNCRGAARAAERSVSLKPRLPEAHLAEGYYHYWCEREYEAALEALETARREMPSSSEILALQGFIQRRQGLLEESTENLDRALELDPRSATLATQLAASYLKLERYADALGLVDRAIALDPSRSAPYQWKAWIVFMQSGDPLQAERVLRGSGLSTDGVLSYRSTWLRIAGEHRRALDLLGKVEADYTYIANFHHPVELARARILGEMELESEARAAYRDTLQLLTEQLAESAEDPSLHAALGLVHAGLGNREEAVRHGDRAAELLPIAQDASVGPIYLSVRGEIYAQLGDIVRACSTIDEVLSVPSHFNLHWFDRHPAFDVLDDEPCFEEIRQQHPPPTPRG